VPIVVELAPVPLLARYLSLYSLTFTLGLGLGPALGGALLAASPNAVWIVGGIAASVVGLGFVSFGHELPAATPALAVAAEPE